jgi:hypothetical protein
MADVFVSYARQDEDRCREIVSRLRELGLDVWFDAHLETGKEFPEELQVQARSAACLLVLWSKRAAASEWVRREATLGRDQKKLCSVRLDRSDLPSSFSQTHTLDLSEPGFAWDHDPWLRLLERIGNLLQRAGLKHLAMARAAGEHLSGKGGGIFECKSIHDLRLEGGKGAWDSRRIASRLVSLDYAAYEDLVEKDEGTIRHWEAIIRRTPESFMLLIMRLPYETSMIVGSWSAFSVTKQLFDRLLTGRATSDNLTLRDIKRIRPATEHYLFFDNISTHPELSASTLASGRLVRNIGETYRQWRANGIVVKEVVGHQYARVGRDLAELYGLKKRPKAKTRYGDIYSQTGENLDKRILRDW